MAKTGERYAAARRVLVERSRSTKVWAAESEMSDEAITSRTGRGWNDWCDLIDAWPDDADCEELLGTPSALRFKSTAKSLKVRH
ncbi:MAG: hypothetical protein ACRC35_00535 [Angustibacter sp.]